MFNHKSMARIALILVVVFGLTVIAYPLLFNPNTASAPTNPAGETPMGPAPTGPQE